MKELNSIYRNFIGLDSLLESVKNIESKTKTNYPPYNILKFEPNRHTIQIALAGFTKDEISVELEKNKITIEGEHNWAYDSSQIIHHGISSRNFKISFGITDECMVTDPIFKDGILSIDVVRIIPEEKQPKKLEIK